MSVLSTTTKQNSIRGATKSVSSKGFVWIPRKGMNLETLSVNKSGTYSETITCSTVLQISFFCTIFLFSLFFYRMHSVTRPGSVGCTELFFLVSSHSCFLTLMSDLTAYTNHGDYNLEYKIHIRRLLYVTFYSVWPSRTYYLSGRPKYRRSARSSIISRSGK